MSAELKQRLQGLQDRLATLRGHLELDAKEERIAELDSLTAAPGFWDDQDKARTVQKEQGLLKGLVDDWTACRAAWEESELLLQLAEEENDPEAEQEVAALLNHLEHKVDATELECMFTGEHDGNNALLTIHAGAGGTEAQDWVSILLRMYLRWAEANDFKTEILDQLPGDEAGIKSVTVMITGRWAYGYLRSEMGIHRLVRISPFDASGRRHTSFASVFIFPELDDTITVEINDKDLRIDTYRASGAGGQHVNKTSSAIRITHIPSGIVVQCQNERSQHRNKDTAMKMLKGHLYTREQRLQKESQQELHGDKKEIAWGSQIRSYVMQPYRLVKDHRTNTEMGNVDSVMDGHLEPFIKAFLLWQN
ncbi:MAG: peptide chain release factor 2 [Desulfobulbaceae bacterium]|nr:peptide chain release factor 2 [Desulfobulbaceae bacterium]